MIVGSHLWGISLCFPILMLKSSQALVLAATMIENVTQSSNAGIPNTTENFAFLTSNNSNTNISDTTENEDVKDLIWWTHVIFR